MKPKPKCFLFNSLSSDRSKVTVKNTFWSQHAQFLSNSYETNAKMFTFQFPILWEVRRPWSRSRKSQKYILVITHSAFIRFIWNQCENVHFSIQRSRSQKGQKHILVTTCSFFVRLIWNQRQNVHFLIPYNLIGRRSRSQKGQKHILAITSSVFVRFKWNQRQKVHFSFPYPLIWWQMWHSQRYALYQVLVLVVDVFSQHFLLARAISWIGP